MSIMQQTGRWNSGRTLMSEEFQNHFCEIFFSDVRLFVINLRYGFIILNRFKSKNIKHMQEFTL
jgi:hypothetical protein